MAAFPFTAGATTKSGALLSAFDHGLPTLVTQTAPDDELVDGRTVVVAPEVRDVVVSGLAPGAYAVVASGAGGTVVRRVTVTAGAPR